ncbi:MAG TPA: RNA methyltransferase substrate-binding domain-containing protein, partial [Levilinea sp.]|nr:RNA methyltransferase substrate-binding domain-containing protein [Levilinea sp.]
MKEWILGRNPVYEVLRARRRHLFRLLIARGVEEKGRLTDIMRLAQASKLQVERVHRQQLDSLGENHQGVALETSAYPYAALQDILGRAAERQEPLFVLLLDTLQNPQNLGTLLRSAEAAGVHGVIIPLRRAAGVTPAVVH